MINARNIPTRWGRRLFVVIMVALVTITIILLAFPLDLAWNALLGIYYAIVDTWDNLKKNIGEIWRDMLDLWNI